MINQDYDYVKRRWREWWKRENEDRPLVSVVAPKNGKIFPEKYENDVAGRWQDIEYVVEREKFYCENTYYGGESFPMFNPNLGPDIYGAILGDCDIEFAEQTSWSKHLEKPELEDCPPFAFDENNRWWKKIKAMTEYAVEKADGGFLVGVTDLHTGLDAITSLYGPERVCTAMYDCPEKLKELLASSEKVAERIFSELFAVTRRRQEGTMNWSQIWDPDGNYYIASCDFACLISENAFSEYIEPTTQREIEMLDSSIFHLDGTGALRHLDKLLKMEKLGGVQWVYGEGQPTARAWRNVVEKIQNAGKNLQINVMPEEIEEVCSFVKPEGAHFCIWTPDEAAAKSVLKRVEKCYLKGVCSVGL